MAHNKEKDREYYLKNIEKIKKRLEEYRKNNREVLRQRQREYRKNNKEEINRRQNEYYKRNKETINRKAKWVALYSKYKITKADYEKLYLKQNGRCAVCKKEFPSLSVDHNHETGIVRGLVCTKCNTALGLVYENTDILLSMIKYIKNNK